MRTDNTTEHDFLDPVFKEILTLSFGQLALPIETQVEVSRLPRTMDALVVLEQAAARAKVQAQTAFTHFRIHNQIEFKGKADPLTRDEYHRIRGRSHLYLGEKNISAALMTVTIISARRPRNVLYHCPLDVKWESEGSGHYRSTGLLPVTLFVCNELEITAKNYPLLLFATSKTKFRQFVEKIAGENNLTYLYYASRVEPEITKEILHMAGRQSLYERQLRRIIESMGADLVQKMTLEERLQGLSVSERAELVRGLSVSEQAELVRGLSVSERLEGLTLEDIRTLDPRTKAELLQLLMSPDREPNS